MARMVKISADNSDLSDKHFHPPFWNPKRTDARSALWDSPSLALIPSLTLVGVTDQCIFFFK